MESDKNLEIKKSEIQIKPTHTHLEDELHANDGMTAASARKSRTLEPHEAFDFDAAEKPGKKYNINDQAYSQSSKEDFHKTVSNFVHEDGTKPPAAIDSTHLEND